MGPPTLTAEVDRHLRYGITDLLDDIRDPRSYAELIATAGQLYEALANYYFRVNVRWSAKGKSIPRTLEQVDSYVASRYREGFETLFRIGDASVVIALASISLARGPSASRVREPGQWIEPPNVADAELGSVSACRTNDLGALRAFASSSHKTGSRLYNSPKHYSTSETHILQSWTQGR